VKLIIRFLLLFALAGACNAYAQAPGAPDLSVTPSSVTLLVTDYAYLSAIDSTGRPSQSVTWSISAPVAEVETEENGSVFITAVRPGRAILTAAADSFSATAVVTILAGEKLPPGTLKWRIDPTPGFETLFVQQAAMATGSSVSFYAAESSKSFGTNIRAFDNMGEQLWSRNVPTLASPTTLKNLVPYVGQLFLNKTEIHSLSELFGKEKGFVDAPNPQGAGLPVDGQTIWVHQGGGADGDLLYLERGRFHDSLVSLSPTDGTERWRFKSNGRLAEDWTVNFQGNIGIVENLWNPISSGLLVIDGKTGEVRSRVALPESSTTINGTRCQDPVRNVLRNVRSSRAGSVFTSVDGNIYLQVETHIESVDYEGCKAKQYSFDDALALLRVSSDGAPEWKTFQRIHADGPGEFKVQSRLFVGETIPDPDGHGVLLAWTYFFPGTKEGAKPYFEARLSHITDRDQSDYTLPMPFWTSHIDSLFDENMVLGDGQALYATNKKVVLRFDVARGQVEWVRQPPTGEIQLQFAAAGGGLVVQNAGQISHFDAQGNGLTFPSTTRAANPNDIGLVQFDPFDHTPLPPLQLRSVSFFGQGEFFGVESGGADGKGGIVFFNL
jgi:outer membrane protein assembly factor BamB